MVLVKPPCVVITLLLPGSGRHFLIYENLVLDQDNIYLTRLSILICWMMYGYCREKLRVNHFWELKDYMTRHLLESFDI